MTFQLALERVEPKAREIHVPRATASVEHGENVSKLLDVPGRHSLRRPPIVKRFEATIENGRAIIPH